jgi:hypothetical protein
VQSLANNLLSQSQIYFLAKTASWLWKTEVQGAKLPDRFGVLPNLLLLFPLEFHGSY